MFERGHEHGREWPRTWPERGHERGRNMTEKVSSLATLQRDQSARPCCGPCSGHVERGRSVARTWPHCDERGQKRGQQHGRGQSTNVARSMTNPTRTWPESMATLLATFDVFSTFFIFFWFFLCSMRMPVANALRTSAYPWNPDSIRKYDFFVKLFEMQILEIGLRKSYYHIKLVKQRMWHSL